MERYATCPHCHKFSVLVTYLALPGPIRWNCANADCGAVITYTPKGETKMMGAASPGFNPSQVDSNYDQLSDVLHDAYEQASGGKGKERHDNGLPFEDQPIMQITRLLEGHPVAALAYQVIKKTIEAGRLYHLKGADAAERELLGAINYSAATILRFRELGEVAK